MEGAKLTAVSEDPFRLDDATIERGRAHLDEIRARLRPSATTPGRSGPGEGRVRVGRRSVAPAEADWSPDRVAADMAAGAERDRLADRVEALESEVIRLRAALAAVLEAAAAGLRPTAVDGDTVVDRSAVDRSAVDRSDGG